MSKVFWPAFYTKFEIWLSAKIFLTVSSSPHMVVNISLTRMVFLSSWQTCSKARQNCSTNCTLTLIVNYLGRFIFTVLLKPTCDLHAAARGISSACDTQMYSTEKKMSVSLFITTHNANELFSY